MYVSATFF